MIVASECQKCMYNAGSTLPIQTYLIPKCLALAEPVSLTTFRINRKAKHQGQDTSRSESMVSKTLIFLTWYTYYEKYTYTQIVKHLRHQIIHVIQSSQKCKTPLTFLSIPTDRHMALGKEDRHFYCQKVLTGGVTTASCQDCPVNAKYFMYNSNQLQRAIVIPVTNDKSRS